MWTLETDKTREARTGEQDYAHHFLAVGLVMVTPSMRAKTERGAAKAATMVESFIVAG